MFKDPDVMNKSAVTFLVCSGGSGMGNIGREEKAALLLARLKQLTLLQVILKSEVLN